MICLWSQIYSRSWGEQLVNAAANTQDGACLDISTRGVWRGHYENTYFDVCIFNPHALTNRHDQLSQCYKRHEHVKKRASEQRAREMECASFTPLILAVTGGMTNEATHLYKRLASLRARKFNQSYSSTVPRLCCKVPFSLFC